MDVRIIFNIFRKIFKSRLGKKRVSSELQNLAKQLKKWNKHKDTKEFLERVISEKLDMGRNKLVNNWNKYCDELDKTTLDEKTKPYA